MKGDTANAKCPQLIKKMLHERYYKNNLPCSTFLNPYITCSVFHYQCEYKLHSTFFQYGQGRN